MARDHKSRKVKGTGVRQLELGAASRQEEGRAPRPGRSFAQRPYEERVVTWLLAREEAHRKRK